MENLINFMVTEPVIFAVFIGCITFVISVFILAVIISAELFGKNHAKIALTRKLGVYGHVHPDKPWPKL